MNRSIQEQFREQAELVDRVFAQRFEELDKRLGPRPTTMDRAIGALHSDVSTLKEDVHSLQKDMVIVREGVSILLKRRR